MSSFWDSKYLSIGCILAILFFLVLDFPSISIATLSEILRSYFFIIESIISLYPEELSLSKFSIPGSAPSSPDESKSKIDFIIDL